MKTRILALIAGLMLVLPSSAYALETNELVAIAAMPLAVAAVADIAEVPTSDLVSVVSAMNHASVPAPQFIEVVRYVPVALVDRREPTFVSYVTTQADSGLVGNAFAVSLADRMVTTYGLNEINVVNPQTVYVVERREFIPTVVATRLQPAPFDALSLVAMPLAVAAVANLTDVPANDLISFISALNQAAVPAPQFVEVVRYSPVMFVDDRYEPQFVNFVTTEVDRGIRGDRLALVIADRYRTMALRDIDIDVVRPPRTVYVDRTLFVPPMVRTRVAEVRAHPHGGPPGQLKKDRGVQTGAEVVHERHSGKGVIVRSDVDNGRTAQQTRVVQQEPRRQVTPRSHGRSEGSGKGKKVAVSAPRDHGHREAVKTASNNDGRERGDRGRGEKGNSKGNSKGKGKGKGNGS